MFIDSCNGSIPLHALCRPNYLIVEGKLRTAALVAEVIILVFLCTSISVRSVLIILHIIVHVRFQYKLS